MRRTFSHTTYYYALYGLAFVITLSLCWYLVVTGYELRQLAARDYSVHRCNLGTQSDGRVLRVLDAVYVEELGVMDFWCPSPEFSQRYDALELRSVHRDHIDLRELYESRYDLVLAKPELMSGSGADRRGGVGYILLAHFRSYGSQLVSLQGTPELNRDWMKGKILGLLDDPNSVSSYQVPKAALSNSGFAEDVEVVYFRSYRQLYKALFKGQVDIIATLVSEEGYDSALQLPPGLILKENIPGPGWYLRQELLQTLEHCELLAAIEQLAANASVDYFRDLQVVRGCHAD